MSGRLAAICRHPVKGFTPEPLREVALKPGEGFAFDRLWAVENGPSGFDPAAPAFIPKQKFTVLASLPRVAAAATRYDEATGVFHAAAPGMPDVASPTRSRSPGRPRSGRAQRRRLGCAARGCVVTAPSARGACAARRSTPDRPDPGL